MREAGAWSLMSAYNKLNGVYAGEHPWLLGEVLKREWGFDGLVVSDWFGTHSTAPSRERRPRPRDARPRAATSARSSPRPCARARSSESVLDDACAGSCAWRDRTGALDAGAAGPERAVDRPEHRALARRAAAEAIVLLENADVADERAAARRRAGCAGSR